MNEDVHKIPFEEVSRNLSAFFHRVIHEHKAVVVENEHGELVEVKSVAATDVSRRGKTDADYAAFLASAGGWTDVDMDAFLEANAASRNLNTRHSVDL